MWGGIVAAEAAPTASLRDYCGNPGKSIYFTQRRKDAKTQSFSMRYLCRTVHLTGDGIIANTVLFFFAFLASLREQLPILG